MLGFDTWIVIIFRNKLGLFPSIFTFETIWSSVFWCRGLSLTTFIFYLTVILCNSDFLHFDLIWLFIFLLVQRVFLFVPLVPIFFFLVPIVEHFPHSYLCISIIPFETQKLDRKGHTGELTKWLNPEKVNFSFFFF